jgi:hypothetical protein
MADELPYNQYYEYYGPDFNLHIQPSNMENLNTPNYLHKQETLLLQCLKELPHAPSVQYSYQPPRDTRFEDEEEAARTKREHESMRDVRLAPGDVDAHVSDRREFYADDRDQDGTTMPAQFVPQLVTGGAAAKPTGGVLSASSTAMPAAVPGAASSVAPAAAAPVAAGGVAPAAASSSSSGLAGLPSLGHAQPSFHPNTHPTAAGAPAISAPLAADSKNNNMDTL